MLILNIKDKDDGYCDVEFEFTDEEVSILLEYAISSLLRKAIDEKKETK
jgi:hypothetical protein